MPLFLSSLSPKEGYSDRKSPCWRSAKLAAAGRRVEVDALAMNVALSTGVDADQIEEQRVGLCLNIPKISLTQDVEALVHEARRLFA